jgi:hypothetical protein
MAAGGASNGLSVRRPFDRWYRYPAGFSPASLDLAMDVVYGDEVGVTVDPFAGAASAGTATIGRSGTFVGLEAHPEIAELAALKFQRRGPPDGLIDAGQDVVARSTQHPIDVESDLIRRCFDRCVLSALVGLREAIRDDRTQTWSDYLKWALLGTLRDVASVKVGWPYQRPALERLPPYRDPTKRFLQRVGWMAEDLANAPAPRDSMVVAGDSRESLPWTTGLGGRRADGCIASPPYLNNFDYADATRLELYFWGTAGSWKQMCDAVRVGMLVATTQQTRKGLAHVASGQLARYPTLARDLRPLIAGLEGERIRRDRGKAYDRVIGPYFLGLAGVLSNHFEVLAPGARCAWLIGDSAPYGIYVDTPALVATLAAELGFDVLDDLKIRSRGQRWSTNGVRHGVELTERLITFSRP